MAKYSSKNAKPMPYFPFYVSDFLSNSEIKLMSKEAVGVLIFSMCYCWLDGFIPSDTATLMRLLDATEESVNEIRIQFLLDPFDPKKLICPQLESLREKRKKYIDRARAAGTVSGKIRRQVVKNK